MSIFGHFIGVTVPFVLNFSIFFVSSGFFFRFDFPTLILTTRNFPFWGYFCCIVEFIGLKIQLSVQQYNNYSALYIYGGLSPNCMMVRPISQSLVLKARNTTIVVFVILHDSYDKLYHRPYNNIIWQAK